MNNEQQQQLDAASISFQMLPKDARWDERILHFLKEMPAWCIILLAVIVLLIMWRQTAAENLMRLIEMAVASLFTAVVGNRVRNIAQAPNIDNSITAETIKTPQVKTDTMPDASVFVQKDGITSSDDVPLDLERGGSEALRDSADDADSVGTTENLPSETDQGRPGGSQS